MIKEAIDKILGLAPPNIHNAGDLEYSDKQLIPIKDPLADPIKVETLSAISDLLDAELDGVKADGVLAHVVDYKTVNLSSKVVDKWARRRTFVRADYERPEPICIGKFLDTDNFVISLLSGFVPGVGDIDYVVKLASSITDEMLDVVSDNGIAQNVSVKRGVVIQGSETVRGRVSLAPYRTFSEVKQPSSDFVFRLRKTGGGINCALFEADGGKWKLDAVAAIEAYLADKLKGVTVVS